MTKISNIQFEKKNKKKILNKPRIKVKLAT